MGMPNEEKKILKYYSSFKLIKAPIAIVINR